MHRFTTEALRSSARLVGDGKAHEAIDVLEMAFQQAVEAHSIYDLVCLSLNSAIICEGCLKDDGRARRILRRALQYGPSETRTLVSLARLYYKLGKLNVARKLLARRRETIGEKNNIGLQEVIGLLLKT